MAVLIQGFFAIFAAAWKVLVGNVPLRLGVSAKRLPQGDPSPPTPVRLVPLNESVFKVPDKPVTVTIFPEDVATSASPLPVRLLPLNESVFAVPTGPVMVTVVVPEATIPAPLNELFPLNEETNVAGVVDEMVPVSGAPPPSEIDTLPETTVVALMPVTVAVDPVLTVGVVGVVKETISVALLNAVLNAEANVAGVVVLEMVPVYGVPP